MICLGCFGGKRVASHERGKAARCFRCNGTGTEPQSEIEFVNAINRRIKRAA